MKWYLHNLRKEKFEFSGLQTSGLDSYLNQYVMNHNASVRTLYNFRDNSFYLFILHTNTVLQCIIWIYTVMIHLSRPLRDLFAVKRYPVCTSTNQKVSGRAFVFLFHRALIFIGYTQLVTRANTVKVNE